MPAWLRTVGVYFGMTRPSDAEQRNRDRIALARTRRETIDRAIVLGALQGLLSAVVLDAAHGFDASIPKLALVALGFAVVLAVAELAGSLHARADAEERRVYRPPARRDGAGEP
jgi:hypothetical protein